MSYKGRICFVTSIICSIDWNAGKPCIVADWLCEIQRGRVVRVHESMVHCILDDTVVCKFLRSFAIMLSFSNSLDEPIEDGQQCTYPTREEVELPLVRR